MGPIHGLAQKVGSGMPVREAPLSQQSNRAADEVFINSTVQNGPHSLVLAQ